MLNRLEKIVKNADPKIVEKIFNDIEPIVTSKSVTEFSLSLYNTLWGNSLLHLLPQYKYIARPVYKFFGGCTNPLISVPASFVATDVIMHGLLANLISNSINAYTGSNFSYDLNINFRLFWFALSIPVALYKYNYAPAKNIGKNIDFNELKEFTLELLKKEQSSEKRTNLVENSLFNIQEIQHIAKKYKLPDLNQESLEKGLRNAATNNNFSDLKIYIKFLCT